MRGRVGAPPVQTSTRTQLHPDSGQSQEPPTAANSPDAPCAAAVLYADPVAGSCVNALSLRRGSSDASGLLAASVPARLRPEASDVDAASSGSACADADILDARSSAGIRRLEAFQVGSHVRGCQRERC
eukprot:scaffold2141_cov282-Pinguiococcus_pyrenoidosus.AAC.9